MPGRDEGLLDAAIEVLAAGGARRLTHRAVDAAAELPVGSTSNRFRTRDALLNGVLQRILERETAMWTQLTADARPNSIDSLAAAIGHLLVDLTGDHRALSLARRTVFVEAANDGPLREEIARARAELTSWMGPLLADLGSSDPVSHVRYLLAMMDGLVGDQLVSSDSDFAPRTAIAALLHGLIGSRPPQLGRAARRTR